MTDEPPDEPAGDSTPQPEAPPSASVSPGARPSRLVLGVVGWMVTGAAAIAVLLRILGFDSGLLVYLTAFAPYAIVLGVSGCVLLWLARWRWWAIVPGVITVIALAFQIPVMIPDPTPSPSVAVVVMTLNLHDGDADPQRVVDLVRQHDVDVLSLQEVTPEAARELVAAGLGDALPYVAARPAGGAQGTALWSRWPLTPQEVPGTLQFRQVAANVTPPGAQALLVAAVHPASAGHPIAAVDTARWSREQKALVAWLEPLPDPVVAAGDFNTTLDQAPMRDLLDHGYQDAAEQSGVFWRPTWPYDRIGPALVSIDHVLSRGGPVADQLAVEAVPGTDHGALIVRLQVPTAS